MAKKYRGFAIRSSSSARWWYSLYGTHLVDFFASLSHTNDGCWRAHNMRGHNQERRKRKEKNPISFSIWAIPWCVCNRFFCQQCIFTIQDTITPGRILHTEREGERKRAEEREKKWTESAGVGKERAHGQMVGSRYRRSPLWQNYTEEPSNTDPVRYNPKANKRKRFRGKVSRGQPQTYVQECTKHDGLIYYLLSGLLTCTTNQLFRIMTRRRQWPTRLNYILPGFCAFVYARCGRRCGRSGKTLHSTTNTMW